MKRPILAAISLAVIFCWQTSIQAEDPKPATAPSAEALKAFDELFGAEVKKVAASSDPKDDVQMAGKLLGAAKDVASQLDLMALICNKAYDLALRDPSGYQIAIDAMKLLIDKLPDSKAAFLKKIADVYQLRYKQARTSEDRLRFGEDVIEFLIESSGSKQQARDIQGAFDDVRSAATIAAAIRSPSKEDIDSLLAELTQKLQVEKQVSQLKARLQTNTSDTKARQQLVKVILVEQDDPSEAQKFLGTGVDEATTLYVPLAVKNIAELQETAALELADWYYKLVDAAASSYSKENMLNDAKDYYELFLKLHKAEDLSRTKAALTISKIDEALAKLSTSSSRQWGDLLKLVDTKHAAGGNWERKEQTIVGTTDGGPGTLTIPVATQDSYVLKGTFTITKGTDAHFILPVGSSSVDLILFGWNGEVCALSKVGGKYGDQNDTTTKTVKFEANKEYYFEAKVRVVAKDASIEVTLNGKPLIKWQGPISSLSLHDGVNPRAEHAFGVTPWSSSVTISSLKLRMLSGNAQQVQPDASGGSPVVNPAGPPPPPFRPTFHRRGRR